MGTMVMSTACCFALLDDARAIDGDAEPCSRLYEGYSHQRVCKDPAELDAFWQLVQVDQAQGMNALVLSDYEWGVRLQGVVPTKIGHASPDAPGWQDDAGGQLRVLFFRDLQHLRGAEVDDWLRVQDYALAARDDASMPGSMTTYVPNTPNASSKVHGPSVAGTLDWSSEVDEAEYGAGIRAIHAAIRDGETYQVNYTHRLYGQAFGSPWGLYRRLRAQQPVSYGALIALPTDEWVLSLSPELFLEVRGREVTARPMKGTAARSSDPVADEAAAQFLQTDVKNRAENLMIVDLLRNDLGRLAEPGSVHVPRLFEVEPCGRVWQMTSTIQAQLRAGVDWPALWRATFPCGSITGAPKRKTLEKIASLERSPRRLYCGAIGWLDAPPREADLDPEKEASLGNATLSVAIRTLLLSAPNAEGLRAATLGVGSGVVLDSDAVAEFNECEVKTRFVRTLDPGFTVFETVHCIDGQTPLWPWHVERLQDSARRLGFPLNLRRLEQERADAVAAVPALGQWRMRIDVDSQGAIRVQVHPLQPLKGDRVSLGVAELTVPRGRIMARFKTSDRGLYDGLVQQAMAQGHFDLLLFSQDGYLLEGGRSNVFVQLKGEGWVTPPVSDGLLPGVMRGRLLADPHLGATERSIHRSELAAAQAWQICNALRGALPAAVPSFRD